MFDGYPPRKYNWKDWLLMIISSSIVLQLVAMILLSILFLFFSNGVQEQKVFETVISQSAIYGTLFSLPLTLFIVKKRKIPLFNRKRLSKEESFIIRGITKEDWQYLIRYIPKSYILYIIGSIIIEKIFGVSEAANQLAIESLFNDQALWQLFLMIVVVAPITEELLFRGMILFSGNKRNVSWIRVIISALIFGMAHISTDINIYTFYTYVGMGFIFSYAGKKTESIEASIIYHFLNNLMGFITILLVK